VARMSRIRWIDRNTHARPEISDNTLAGPQRGYFDPWDCYAQAL